MVRYGLNRTTYIDEDVGCYEYSRNRVRRTASPPPGKPALDSHNASYTFSDCGDIMALSTNPLVFLRESSNILLGAGLNGGG